MSEGQPMTDSDASPTTPSHTENCLDAPSKPVSMMRCSVCTERVCFPDNDPCCYACTEFVPEQPQAIVVPNSCFSTNSKDTVFVHGFAESAPVQMVVDTGSCVTLLNSKFARSLSLNISPSPVKLSAVNNSSVPVIGQAPVAISISKFNAMHTVIVADIEPDMLIGIDFLRSHGCTLDFDNEVLETANCSVPLQSANQQSHTVYRITLAHKVTIPAYSQIIVPGKLESNDTMPTSAGCIIPSDKFLSKYHIAMASVVASPDCAGTVPIRLQNLHSRPATIQKRYDIAQFDCNVLVDDDSSLDDDQDEPSQCNYATEEPNTSVPHELFRLDHLDTSAKAELAQVLDANKDVISCGQFDLGKTDVITHQIETDSEKPKRQPP
eukprot:scpid84504/ scgid34234/ 